MSNDVDVLIIGAGAAGSVLAFRLSERGLRVHVLERGGRAVPHEIEHDEYAMMPRLYKNGGPQTSTDNAISILQGAGIGGSTVINNAIWLRPDLDRLLPEWNAAGASVDRAAIESAYGSIEQLLHVSTVPPNMMSRSTDVFTRGCQATGTTFEYLHNNRVGCTGCGWCNYGCRYSRKTSALVTFVPWAESHGATFEPDCLNIRLQHRGDTVHGAEYERDGVRHTVQARQVVVSCGAIGSSALLLSSGISVHGQVGRRFHLMGGVLCTAYLEEDMASYDGIGLTAIAQPDPRYVLETFFATPGAYAVTLPGWGARYGQRMRRYTATAQAGSMVATAPRGQISIRRGRVRIDLKLSDEELAAIRDGQRELARIYLAGGATSVVPGLLRDVEITNPTGLDAIGRCIRRPRDLIFGSAHPQGGNSMSDDPRRGVVTSDFRVHGFANLSIADASVFPTNLRANCQATTMAMAWLAADRIAA